MSTVSMKKKYSSVMEKIIKNAVSETSKVLETVIADLKAEVLRVNSENENLKIRCSQFEEVIKKRSVYRETGTSPDPWIIGKCDKAVQCDLIPHFSKDDPNLSDNETRSESSFGPIHEKESSNDSFSFPQTKDIDDDSPLDLSSITIPEKTAAYYRKIKEAMLVDRSGLHLQDSDTCYKTPEIEIQEDVCIEYAETDQSLLERQEEDIKDFAERECIPLQEDINCISIEMEDVICEKPQPKECDPCPLLALAAESPSSSNDPQPATEELLEMEVEMDKQSTTLSSSELKSGDSSATEDNKTANVLIGFEHKTCTEIDDPAVQSVSSEKIKAKEPGNTSQSLPPPKSQYFLRRQRCTSVTLEDAMLLLDAVSQQKYKSLSTKKHQTKESLKNAANPKLCNIPEVTQDSSNSEEIKCSNEPLQPHATHSSVDNEMADDMELNVCMTNMDRVGQQKQTERPSSPSLLVGVVPMSTPTGQKSPHVTEADSASLGIDHPHDLQELPSPSAESSATLVTESTTPNQTLANLDENMQTVDINTTNMDIEESDKTDCSVPKPSLIELPSIVSVPLVAVRTQNKKTSKHEQLLETEEIVSADNFTNDSQDHPKSLSEECSHTECLSEPTERSEVTKLTPDHLAQKNNQAIIDMSPSKLLAKTLPEPTLQTSAYNHSELQENDQKASSPIPSSNLNPPTPDTLLIKLPGETVEQSSSVVKTPPASTLSPAQLSAVVSAVRSTQSKSSPTSPSAGTPSGKKSLVAVPFSLQAVLRPHHKIIVIPRQCKVSSTQAIAKSKMIVLKQKAPSTDATTTFISTTDVNLNTNAGDGNTVSAMDQQQTTSVSPSTKSVPDTSALTTEPSSPDPAKSPCKNTVQIKLNRLPFPVSSAQSVSVTDMPVNASSPESVSDTNIPVNESPTIISATNTPENEPLRIIVRKKRGRPAKKIIVAINPSEAQSEEEKLQSTIIGPSPKEASPIQPSSGQNAKSIDEIKPTAVQSPHPETHSPTLANQSPSTRKQSPAPRSLLPVMKTLLPAFENLSHGPKTQASITKIRLRSPENLLPTPEQLIPVMAGDHSYPQHRMTKSQFLAKLDVSPVAQNFKKADSIEKDIQKASLVDRLRSHLKPHIKTKKKTLDVSNSEVIEGAISNTTEETWKPEGEDSSLPDPVRHNDDNKMVTPKTSAPKNVSKKSQVQRKRSSKRNLTATKRVKRQKLKNEESDDENITSSAKASPMQRKIINSNALLSCVRKGIKKKSFLCKFCRKEFGKKKEIELHIQVHVGKKPFQCNICHRRFSRTMELSRHLKRHNAEKKYQCTSCGKSFLEYNNLKRHTYIHTGEKPFSCPHCPSTFTQSGHMKAHIRSKHKDIES